MKPLKVALPLANWLMRLALAVYLILTWWGSFTAFQLEFTSFWYAVIYIVFAAFLVIGGFIPEQGITVVSGLIIFLLSIVLMFTTSYTIIDDILPFLLPATVGFYFLCRGNKS